MCILLRMYTLYVCVCVYVYIYIERERERPLGRNGGTKEGITAEGLRERDNKIRPRFEDPHGSETLNPKPLTDMIVERA